MAHEDAGSDPDPRSPVRKLSWSKTIASFCAVVAVLAGVGAGAPAIAASASGTSARAAAASTHTITWDKYSLMIDGNRAVIWSGEMHPFRLPSPSLWRDVLQKLKANGYNAVSVYFDWGYHSPKS